MTKSTKKKNKSKSFGFEKLIETDGVNRVATLQYNLDDPDAKLEFKRATKVINAYIALWEFANEVLRPIRKYGAHGDDCINELLKKCTAGDDSHGVELVEKLEEKFYEILEEHDINLSEDIE